jgi:hypothetical protein
MDPIMAAIRSSFDFNCFSTEETFLHQFSTNLVFYDFQQSGVVILANCNLVINASHSAINHACFNGRYINVSIIMNRRGESLPFLDTGECVIDLTLFGWLDIGLVKSMQNCRSGILKNVPITFLTHWLFRSFIDYSLPKLLTIPLLDIWPIQLTSPDCDFWKCPLSKNLGPFQASQPFKCSEVCSSFSNWCSLVFYHK